MGKIVYQVGVRGRLRDQDIMIASREGLSTIRTIDKYNLIDRIFL
tara:strand:- start:1268 stop:1402 length:135 start_codon:yes stop_codon:yes gene_type:complete